MNKIVKLGDKEYKMICEDGQEFQGKMHLEKGKTWLVKFPKDNPSGRQFFTQSLVDATGEYEFETKTEHRVGISTSWRSRLTEDEKTRIAELEQEIESIKQEAMKRQPPKVDKNSAEYIMKQIEVMKANLAALQE